MHWPNQASLTAMDNPKDVFADILEKLPLERREEFLRFIEDGNASDQFRYYLDHDPVCLQAVEEAFELQAERIQSAAFSLQEQPVATADTTISLDQRIHQFACTIGDVAKLTQPARERAIEGFRAEFDACRISQEEVLQILYGDSAKTQSSS